MQFGFALELSEIDLWNTNLLDTHLDLLSPDKYTDIFVFQEIFKTSSRRLQDVFARRLQDVFEDVKLLR